MNSIEFCLKNPERLTDNERIRRFLISTSYNHACITHLALACGLPHLETDEEQEDLARRLLEIERTLETDVFVRTFALNITETHIQISVRATDISKVERRVKDHPSNHEEVLKINLERNLSHVEAESTFLALFFKEVTALLSERRQRTGSIDVDHYTWMCRVAEGQRRNDSAHESSEDDWQCVEANELTRRFNHVFKETGRIIFTTRSISFYQGSDAITMRRPVMKT